MAASKFYSISPFLTVISAPGVPVCHDQKKLAPMETKSPAKHRITDTGDGKTVKCVCGAVMTIGGEVLSHMMGNRMFDDIVREEKKQ